MCAHTTSAAVPPQACPAHFGKVAGVALLEGALGAERLVDAGRVVRHVGTYSCRSDKTRGVVKKAMEMQSVPYEHVPRAEASQFESLKNRVCWGHDRYISRAAESPAHIHTLFEQPVRQGALGLQLVAAVNKCLAAGQGQENNNEGMGAALLRDQAIDSCARAPALTCSQCQQLRQSHAPAQSKRGQQRSQHQEHVSVLYEERLTTGLHGYSRVTGRLQQGYSRVTVD